MMAGPIACSNRKSKLRFCTCLHLFIWILIW
jgi:hypothetical protein